MTTPAAPIPLYLLDTNILLASVRMGPLGQYIQATYSLSSLQPTPIISVVTEGEMRALALKLRWGATRVSTLNQLIGRLRVVPLPFLDILAAYATIDAYCEKHGRVLGKNDLWIAATAHVTGAHLLTTDRDFDSLDGVFLTREWIDPARR